MKKLLTLLLLSLPFGAWAHEGHSHFDATALVHYIFTLEHGLPLLIVVAAFGWLVFRSYRKKAAEKA